jgi:hypothetical protein
MDYRVNTYKTLFGKQEILEIELGDHVYGEWIIYEGDSPKFHICSLNDSDSGKLIKHLIENQGWTIEKIINKVNRLQNRNFHFGKRPLFSRQESSTLKEINLAEIPIEWIEKLKTKS